MKNYLKILLTLAAFALIGVFAADNFAQIKTGGYKKVSETDAGVVAAADFAAQTQGEEDSAEITLQSIEKAERQTVAGTNYKLCIEVFRIEAGDDVEVRQFIQTVVFRSLKKEYTLKSWEEAENCGE
jgi:hypothetical protein